MTRLFNAFEQQISEAALLTAQKPLSSSSTIDVVVKRGDTWSLEAPESLPKEVRIAYKTETGEMQYMSFVPVAPSSGLHPFCESSGGVSSAEETLNPAVVVRQDSGNRTGTSIARQGIEDRETCIPSPEALQLQACGDTLVAESDDDCEGKDVGFKEVRLGLREYAISVCSLD